MICPFCNKDNTSVLDTRSSQFLVRRRRRCSDCSGRFFTEEKVTDLGVMVLKKDGTVQTLDFEKMKKGVSIVVNTGETSGSNEAVEKLMNRVRPRVQSLVARIPDSNNQIKTTDIGGVILKELSLSFDLPVFLAFALKHMGLKDRADFEKAQKQYYKFRKELEKEGRLKDGSPVDEPLA